MSNSMSTITERRDAHRRFSDRMMNDLYKTFSTPQCHSCLEHTAGAVLLLDKDRQIIYATAKAEQIIRQSSISFTIKPVFNLPPSSNTSRFRAFVDEKSTDPGPLSQLLVGGNEKDILLLTCFRLPEPTVPNLQAARFLISLRDPNHFPIEQWRLFTEQFNLTQAEARLCLALANGLTLNDYCANWHVTLNTARSQLKIAFAKTSTHGQPHLLRLIYLFMQR